MINDMIKKGCKVGFFGIGCSNIALLCHLPLDNCRITLRSDRTVDRTILPVGVRVEKVYEGENALKEIDEDILFLSPSVRRDRKEFVDASARGVILSSDAEMFFSKNRRDIFAVSGSDGKSTTATLINMLLNASGLRSKLIGNIGEPMINHLGSDADCFVCELSSFMLSYSCPIAERGCVTNISPNHLDWHKDFEEYKKTKIKLLKSSKKAVVSDEIDYQGEVYGIVSDRLEYGELKKRFKAEVYITVKGGAIYRNQEKLIGLEQIRAKERHNIKNLMMAIAMTDGIADRDAICSVASSFVGLPHRCERFLLRDGIEYIDSSIDSTPERTAQTLRSLDRQVVLILGGRSKGLNYRELRPVIEKYAKRVLITGENAEEIYNAIADATKAEILPDLESAGRRGSFLAKEVGTLLLSPASTSYDAYINFAERGEKFKKIIRNLS